MPYIVSILVGALLQVVGSFIGRAIVALGFGFVEYKGISYLLNSIMDQAKSMMGILGSSLLGEWAGFFRIDVHLSIILSAIGVKMLLNALGGDKVRRLVAK